VGLLFGIAAYGIWALFPFYFRAVEYVSPIEVIANRIIWSFVLLMIIMTLTRRWGGLREAASNRKALGLVAVGSIFVAANWSTYVIAISTNQALQASLGYFINPLVIVGLGVFVLKERLRPAQWLAVGIAALAVALLTISYGSLPWIALILAFSWATYGFIKRYVDWGAIESTAVETAVLTPVALAVMIILLLNGTAVFFSDGVSTSLLLMLAGPITTIPLLFFTGAATRVPFSTLGLMQYITPIGLFIVGVVFFDEGMSQMRWIGFAMIWVALVIFTIDARRHLRDTRTADPELMPEE
jgi:chloramphenicol-sensitive protein RarD